MCKCAAIYITSYAFTQYWFAIFKFILKYIIRAICIKRYGCIYAKQALCIHVHKRVETTETHMFKHSNRMYTVAQNNLIEQSSQSKG